MATIALMEHLISLINSRLPETIVHSVTWIHATPGELLVALMFVLVAAVLNWLMRRPLLRWIKYSLYRHRREEFYRLLFMRIDRMIRPLRLLLTIYLLKKAVEIFWSTLWLDTVFFTFYWLFLFWWIYEIVKFLLYLTLSHKIKRQKEARTELYNLFLNISRVFLGFLFLLLVLSRFGINLTALVTSLGIGGAIIGLGAKDTITNFLDSVRLVSEDAFRQGDWIATDQVEGFVTEMGLTSTKIRTFDNALVTVPNSILANTYVKNWTRRMVGRRIKFHLRLKLTTDTRELERVIYEIYEMLHRHPDIVNKNKLRYIRRMKKTYENGLFNIEDRYGVRRTLLVYLDEIGAYSMNVLIYAFSISVNWEEWLRVKQDVIKKILHIVDESSLELAVPRQEILLEAAGERSGSSSV
ncbi:mechanosensitive ion channel domain-containing protein [Nitratifractor sp.]|uniref:mechanosensitive ion channel family protein n=1 Tax=Nitratifractor sp. TaxID=2268144 RepID=UPI0025D7B4D5|nr:mechanosensitive ion channel domain-containing protein [Nitratifractor sp.]